MVASLAVAAAAAGLEDGVTGGLCANELPEFDLGRG